MSTQENIKQLDKKRNKRLKKLAADWPESCWPEKLTLPDLRLLLENFSPLQELIRDVVNNTVKIANTTNQLNQESNDLRKLLDEAEISQRKTIEELKRSNDECQKLKNDLEECSSSVKALLKTKKDLEQTRKQQEKQIQQIQTNLNACQDELICVNRASVEVDLLRQDKELAQHLQLDELSDNNQEALIQVVAVLAQRDNLERLWNVLRDRCESQDRAASDSEQALLIAAITWYNYNWRTLPYRLVEVLPRTAYNFEQHLRIRQTPTGEIVEMMRLPGIADNSSKLICKVLVSTQ